MKSSIFGERLSDLFPVIEPNCSDSGNFDNVLEFLTSVRPLFARVYFNDGSRSLAEKEDDYKREKGLL